MDDFSLLNLPPEMVKTVCQQLPYKELGRLVRSSSRIKDLCQDVLNKRLKAETDMMLVRMRQEMDKLNGPPWLGMKFNTAIFTKPKSQVIIERLPDLPDLVSKYNIRQNDIGKGTTLFGGQSELILGPWILGNLKPPSDAYEYYSEIDGADAYKRSANLDNDQELRIAVENLVKQGYELYVRK